MFDFFPNPTNVLVRSKGFRSIYDGRVFFINYLSLHENPMTGWPELFGHTLGVPTRKGFNDHVAGKDMVTHCPNCDTWLKKQMDKHTLWWMAETYKCPEHPEVVWWDIYPKTSPSQSWDFENALTHYADRHKSIPLSSITLHRAEFISNENETQDEKKILRSEAPLLFVFTPDGLVDIPGALETWRSIHRNGELKNLFVRIKSKFVQTA